MTPPLVQVQDLARHYPVKRGLLRERVGTVRAVDGVSFDIHEGETLGLVGESGCGKSTTGRAILQLVKPTKGTVRFEGTELTTLPAGPLRRARRHMQMIFQDSSSSLDPRLQVRSLVCEPLEIHGLGTPSKRRERVRELLELVGLSADLEDRRPHQLSGGQKQRIGIARALATHPRFIVADEPFSALDVSLQAQVANLLSDLKDRLRLTYLLIAHDLAVVRHLSDRVAVMYLGRIVEMGSREAVFARPRHPYTQALLSAVPSLLASRGSTRTVLEGDVPDPARPPTGCRFHPRCPWATDVCRGEDPEPRDLGAPEDPHLVACHHAEATPGPAQ